MQTSEWSFLISILRRSNKSISWFISDPSSRSLWDVLSTCLYYHKTKRNRQNRLEIKWARGTEENGDKILVNLLQMRALITDWEVIRFQGLFVSPPID